MNISLDQYRARIGVRNENGSIKNVTRNNTFLNGVLKKIFNKLMPLFVLYNIISLFAISLFFVSTILLVNTIIIVSYIFLPVPYFSLKNHMHITICLPFLLIKYGKSVIHNNTLITKCVQYVIISQSFSLINKMLLLMSGINFKNPGPKSNKTSLTFAVWNMDSILAREGVKIHLVESLDATRNIDLYGVCESYLKKILVTDKSTSMVSLRIRLELTVRKMGGVKGEWYYSINQIYL